MSIDTSQIPLTSASGTEYTGTHSYAPANLLNDNVSGIQTFGNTEFCYNSWHGDHVSNIGDYVQVDFDDTYVVTEVQLLPMLSSSGGTYYLSVSVNERDIYIDDNYCTNTGPHQDSTDTLYSDWLTFTCGQHIDGSSLTMKSTTDNLIRICGIRVFGYIHIGEERITELEDDVDEREATIEERDQTIEDLQA